MLIKVYVSQAKAIKAGSEKYGQIEATIDVAKLTERQRDALVESTRYSTDSLSLDTGIVSESTIIAALDKKADMLDQEKNNHAQELENTVQKFLADPDFETWHGYINNIEAEALKDSRLVEKNKTRLANLARIQKERQEKELIEIAERKRINNEQEEREAIEKENHLQEIKLWIEKHGSTRLQKCFEQGYPCQKLYVHERAVIEFPEFSLDYNNKAEYKTKVSPSETALDLEITLEKQGIDTEIIWLTDDGIERDYDDDLFEPCEAVIINNYLGKHTLIKKM